ncbi:MAG: arginase [Desulfobacteraceae bacterium]|nr:arginase [Desulfobacteraceae bacterium]
MEQKISIIGVPMDFGQLHRGVDMGPAAIRYSKLMPRLRSLGLIVEDRGDIKVPVRDAVEMDDGIQNYTKEIAQICEDIYEEGKRAISENRFPLFIGGDHSIAIGTVGGVSHESPIGLLWIDAHGDFNTPETSPSGNIHGMPLSILTGEGEDILVNIGRDGAKVDPENVVLIGIRDLDEKEKQRLNASDITVFTMRDIDEQGISAVLNKALMKFVHLKKIHVSLDMDALDSIEVPGVGTPVAGGLTYREAHLLMEMLSDTGKLASMDLVELNPILDSKNKTASLAVELIVSALGKSIL